MSGMRLVNRYVDVLCVVAPVLPRQRGDGQDARFLVSLLVAMPTNGSLSLEMRPGYSDKIPIAWSAYFKDIGNPMFLKELKETQKKNFRGALMERRIYGKLATTLVVYEMRMRGLTPLYNPATIRITSPREEDICIKHGPYPGPWLTPLQASLIFNATFMDRIKSEGFGEYRGAVAIPKGTVLV